LRNLTLAPRRLRTNRALNLFSQPIQVVSKPCEQFSSCFVSREIPDQDQRTFRSVAAKLLQLRLDMPAILTTA
jgi:hypothetical protein